MVSKSFSSLFLTLGVVAPLTVALSSTSCSNKFEGCASTRSCPSDAGEGGGGGTAGTGGSSGRGGVAGKGGAGGTAGKGGTAGTGGESGEAGAASGKGGTGGKGGAGSGGKGGSAGSATEPMGGEGGMDTEPEPDVTRPTIVSVSPDDGETGVLADTVIRITFSEPMDRTTVEAAYQSADIPEAMTTMRWSSDDTVLTITPNDELTYAEGAKGDLSFAALQFAVEMTDTAEDQAGNRLTPQAWSFSTLRRVTQVLVADGDDVRRARASGNHSCTNMDLGDYRTNEALLGFVQFHLSELAPGSPIFEVATFWGERIAGGAGDPRALDGVHLYEFEGDIMTVDLQTPTGPDLGVFLDSYADFPNLDVLPIMTSSYAEDGLIQLRMKVVPDSDGDSEDDYYRLTCSFDLGVVYLVP